MTINKVLNSGYGHFMSLDDKDYQTMKMHEIYKHRTPAERINIIQPRPIVYNSKIGIYIYS